MQSMHPAWPLPVRTNATATAVFLRPKHWASSARRLKSSSRLHSLHKKGITRKNFRTRPAPSRTCCRLAAVLVLLHPWWRRRRKPLSPNSNGCKNTVQKWIREWLFYDILCILLYFWKIMGRGWKKMINQRRTQFTDRPKWKETKVWATPGLAYCSAQKYAVLLFVSTHHCCFC